MATKTYTLELTRAELGAALLALDCTARAGDESDRLAVFGHQATARAADRALEKVGTAYRRAR